MQEETEVQTPTHRLVQRVNEWGNTYSGLLAVIGVAALPLFFVHRRRRA
jgi:hypothetical protein